MDRSFTRRGMIGLSAGALGWTALAAASGTQESGGGGDRGRPDFGGYLDGANNYDGEVVDETGNHMVTVTVGAGDGLAFDPAAVHVDTGATVQWEWTGEGGAHSVVAEDGTFEAGKPVQTTGVAFEYTFEEDGIYKYHCLPHEGSGMLGAVVVGTDYPRLEPTATPTATPEPTPEGEWLSAAPGVDWPSREFDAANTSHNPETSGPVEDVRVSGSIQFYDPLFDPVLADGTLYFTVWDRFGAVAVDAATGKRQWTRSISGRVWAAADGHVYVTTVDGEVRCLDAGDGRTLWTRQPVPEEVRDLQITDGSVVVAAGTSAIALDPSSGARQWLTPVGGPAVGIAIDDGTVYATSQPHFGTDYQDPHLRVTALDAATGDEQWSFSRTSFPPTRPTVADGTVYVGSESHVVRAIDAVDGTERWSVDLGGSITGLAVVDDEAAGAVAGTVYAGCTDSYLYALDADSGDRQWRTLTRGTVNPPVVADGIVYATNMGRIIEHDEDGHVAYDDDGDIGNNKAIHGFDGATGERLWTVELDEQPKDGRTPSYIGDEPIVADGRLYLGVNASDQVFKLYTISGDAGRETPAATASSPASTPTSEGSGPGFTAVGTALGMLGVAGLQRLRDDD